jgi:hypothetical protein
VQAFAEVHGEQSLYNLALPLFRYARWHISERSKEELADSFCIAFGKVKGLRMPVLVSIGLSFSIFIDHIESV